jgi:hypothetical protein
MKYRYTGPGPVPDPEGEIVRPGDEREFGEEPPWGPWELLGAPEADEPPADDPAPPAAPLLPVPPAPAKEM